MYITKRGKKGAEYVYLIESKYVKGKIKQKIIRKFGRYSKLIENDPDAFAKLQEQYNTKHQTTGDRTKEALDIIKNGLPPPDPILLLKYPRLNYAPYILSQIWSGELNFAGFFSYLKIKYPNTEFDLNKVISALVCLMTFSPEPVSSAYAHKADFMGAPFEGVSYSQMTDALKILAEQKDSVMRHINKKPEKTRGPEYFMTCYEVLRDGLKDPLMDEDCVPPRGSPFFQSIFTLALVTDGSAFPVDFEIFYRGDADGANLPGALEALKAKYGIQEVTEAPVTVLNPQGTPIWPEEGEPVPDRTGPNKAESDAASRHASELSDCLRFMLSALGTDSGTFEDEMLLKGQITCCVLALILMRILQQRIKDGGAEMTLRDVSSGMGDAQVLVSYLREDAAYIKSWDGGGLYRGRETLSPREMTEFIKKTDPAKNPTDALMKSAGLTPLPGQCDRTVLSQCLKTEIGDDLNLIDSMMYTYCTGKVHPRLAHYLEDGKNTKPEHPENH